MEKKESVLSVTLRKAMDVSSLEAALRPPPIGNGSDVQYAIDDDGPLPEVVPPDFGKIRPIYEKWRREYPRPNSSSDMGKRVGVATRRGNAFAQYWMFWVIFAIISAGMYSTLGGFSSADSVLMMMSGALFMVAIVCAGGATNAASPTHRRVMWGRATFTVLALMPLPAQAAKVDAERFYGADVFGALWDVWVADWRWAAGAAAATCAAVLAGRWWESRVRAVGEPSQGGKPNGWGPAQVGYVWRGKAHPSMIPATLLHARDKGLVKVYLEDGMWAVQGVQRPSAWDDVDPITKLVGGQLGLTTFGNYIVRFDDYPLTRHHDDDDVLKYLGGADPLGMSGALRSWAAAEGWEERGVANVLSASLWAALTFAYMVFIGFGGGSVLQPDVPLVAAVPVVALLASSMLVVGSALRRRHTAEGSVAVRKIAGYRDGLLNDLGGVKVPFDAVAAAEGYFRPVVAGLRCDDAPYVAVLAPDVVEGERWGR